MKEITLQPEQIIVPGEYNYGKKSILQIYFRIFDMEHGKDLPPSIVIWKDNINSSYLNDAFSRGQGQEEFYQKLIESKAEYLLLDGNHKSIAATLCHSPIHSLELEKSSDIAKVIKMVENGELFNFPHDETTLVELANGFIYNIFSTGRTIMTVKERVDLLASNGHLPQYMKERYLKGK
jgi:hypothetical protein